MKALFLLPLLLVSSSSLLGCAVNDTAPFHESDSVERVSQPLKDAAVSARSDVVAVLASEQGTDSWCTGIVLEPSLILTAEHCLSPARGPDMALDCATATLPSISAQAVAWVVTGENVETSDASLYHRVSNVKLPAGAARLCGQDIVLLELAEPLQVEAVATITAELPADDPEFLAVGYGTDGVTSGIQRQNPQARIACVGAQCEDARVDTNEFLANSYACEGDSGSPAIDSADRSFAMAVRSNITCSETAYLQLGAYYDWLASNVIAVATAQGRDAPAWALGNPLPVDNSTPLDSGADLGAAATTELRPRDLVTGGGCTVNSGGRKPKPGMQLLLMLTGLAAMVARRKTPKSNTVE